MNKQNRDSERKKSELEDMNEELGILRNENSRLLKENNKNLDKIDTEKYEENDNDVTTLLTIVNQKFEVSLIYGTPLWI